MKRPCSQCNIKREPDKFVGTRGRLCVICRKKNAKLSARARHLQATYNITLEEYDELVKHGCQACGGARPYNYPVDHDHSLVEAFGVRASVRGVLCKRCNKALRDVRDDQSVLRGLITYLQTTPAKKVLYP